MLTKYRIYLLDADGEVGGPSIELECRDDAHVIACIEELDHFYEIEVWRRSHLLGRFPPTRQRHPDAAEPPAAKRRAGAR